MVQVLDDNSPQTQRFAALSRLMQGLGNAGQSFGGAMNERQTRGALSDRFGEEFKNIKNPDVRNLLLKAGLDKEKIAGDYEADSKNYETMKNAFGPKFADVWLATGQGERTNLTKAALEARSRGIDLEQIIGQRDPSNNDQIPTEGREPTTKKGEVPDYKLSTQGMNPKEIVDFKSALRKENMPIWKEAVDNLGDYKELNRDISILEKINEKKNLPEGIEKLLIDPETGAPYPLGTIIKSPNRDVQQWAKTIARQATRAQTAFPGRVTNFDLAAYMRQFPGLFNTYEGRKVILEQMKLSNKANLLMSQAMDKVYSKHKLSGITPEDAFEQARSMVEDKLADIDQQLIQLSDEGEILSAQGEKLPGTIVDVIGPDGKMYEIDEREIEQLPPGYRVK